MGYGIHVTNDNFFQKVSNFTQKTERTLKTGMTLSLILRLNLRLGGYSIWSASTSRIIFYQDFGGLSTSQPRINRKYLEDYSMYSKEGLEATRRMFGQLEVLEDASPSTRRLQDSATKSLEA